MAELTLSTVWKIEGWKIEAFTKKLSALVSKVPLAQRGKCLIEDDELLPQLRHKSLPGLQWKANLYTSPKGDKLCRKGFSAFYLKAQFGSSEGEAAAYVLVNFATALLDANGSVLVRSVDRMPDVLTKESYLWCHSEAFKTEELKEAALSDGSLLVGIDLTILKIGELLECRKLLRGLLANNTHADFKVKVGEETFQLHKSVLAETSTVFSSMLECGMEEAAEGVLTLPDTTPAAFKAFSEAMYYDNWNFLSNVDLTQDVLHLAEKFNVGRLKTYCDEALAEKVNETNALEILTKSAALCNAKKTVVACTDYLAANMQFKESQIWLDFKKRSRGVALEILDVVSDKLEDKVKQLERQKCELDAANAALKRKCEEEKEKASSSKRRRT